MSKRKRSARSWKDSKRTKKLVAAFSRALNRVLSQFGWKVVRRERLANIGNALKYEYYWHKANKRIDICEIDGFGPLVARTLAEHRTGMRQDRLYTLWQAVATLPPGRNPVVEVGAFRGGSARFVAEALRWHGRDNCFFVCDTFQGHTVVDETLDGPHKVGLQFADNSYADVAAYLSDLPNVQLVQGDFRVTSRQLEPSAPFAFVHVDVDVYPVTQHCLEFFAPRVQTGSLIVVDDYGFTTCRGVRQAVDEFVRLHPEFRAFHLLTGQALLTRLG
jgi:O-methyltransferase